MNRTDQLAKNARTLRRASKLARAIPVAVLLLLTAVSASADSAAPRAALAPSPVATVAIHGFRMAYRTVGSGRPLVLITGFDGTQFEWDPGLIRALAVHHRVILFDNRGAGLSTPANVNGLTAAEMASDTAALMRALRIGRADVLGWSMGGQIAQELTLRYPKMVRRLVLASTFPGGSTSPQTTNKHAIAVFANPSPTVLELLSTLFPTDQSNAANAYVRRVLQQPDLTTGSFTVPPQTATEQGKVVGPRTHCPGCGTYARLGRIHIPVLITSGVRDIVVPPTNSLLLHSRIHGSILRMFPDAGHAVMFQDFPRYAADVNHFLAAPRSR